jgi:transmembrane sensor
MNSPISEEALREAAAWMTRLKAAQGGEGEHQEFVEWLKRSPVNVRHYLELASLDVELRDETLFAGVEIEGLREQAEGNVVRWSAGTGDAPTLTLPRRPGEGNRARVRWKPLAAAAAVVAITLAALWGFRSAFFDQHHYRSALGELRSITLPDGSLVTLNTQSDIRVRYSSTARTVELLRGEALFRVAQQATQPFRVLVGDSVVQAIGTEFNIDRRAEGALVTVVEGRVSVLPPSHPGPSILLSAGEQLSMIRGAQVRRLPPVQISRVTTWTQRRLVFDQAPVSEVVSQLNRYNRVQLSVTDTALARRRVTGTFESGDPESFVQFLEQQGGVSVRARDDGSLELTGSAQGGN